MNTVTLEISRDDAECLMVILDSQAERLRKEDAEAWDKMCNVTERLAAAMEAANV